MIKAFSRKAYNSQMQSAAGQRLQRRMLAALVRRVSARLSGTSAGSGEAGVGQGALLLVGEAGGQGEGDAEHRGAHHRADFQQPQVQRAASGLGQGRVRQVQAVQRAQQHVDNRSKPQAQLVGLHAGRLGAVAEQVQLAFLDAIFLDAIFRLAACCQDAHAQPALPDLGNKARNVRHRAGRPVDVGTIQVGDQQMTATEDVERQVAIDIVIAMKEAPLLVTVQRHFSGRAWGASRKQLNVAQRQRLHSLADQRCHRVHNQLRRARNLATCNHHAPVYGSKSEPIRATQCRHRRPTLRRPKSLSHKNLRRFRAPMHLLPVKIRS